MGNGNSHYNGERDGDGVWDGEGLWIPDDTPFEDENGNYIEMDVPDDVAAYDND